MTTGDLIRYGMNQFEVERKERIIVNLANGGRAMRTHGPNDKIMWLPNGEHVKVSVDDSGIATQVTEDEALHAIARPHPIRASFAVRPTTPTVSHRAHPRPVKTAFIPRRTA